MQHFHGQARDIQKQNEEQQLTQFNTQFTVYEGREGITIYDILTVINLAKDNNAKNNEDENKITVNIDTGVANPSSISQCEEDTKKTSIENLIVADRESIRMEGEEFKGLPTYTCKIGTNAKGRVNNIKFTRKSN